MVRPSPPTLTHPHPAPAFASSAPAHHALPPRLLPARVFAELFVDDDGGREYILLKYSKLDRPGQRMCEAWRAVRVAQLLEKYGTANVMEWHECDTREGAWEVLLSYADDVLVDRFSETDDVVSRVLGGGVANRWLTRLRPTETWLGERLRGEAADGGGAAAGAAEDELSEFFAYALRRDRDNAVARGWPAEQAEWVVGKRVEELSPEPILSSYLSRLTLNSRPFCEKEVEITHKGLISKRQAMPKATAPLTGKR
jgi:hypothetical protein